MLTGNKTLIGGSILAAGLAVFTAVVGYTVLSPDAPSRVTICQAVEALS